MIDKVGMEKHDKAEMRPSILAMLSTAIAAAAGFFVITRSGIAGTLVGAAVFSVVYSGASHWIGHGLERLAGWWLDRRGIAREVTHADPLVTRADPLAPTEVLTAQVSAEITTAVAQDAELRLEPGVKTGAEPHAEPAAYPHAEPAADLRLESGASPRRFGAFPPVRKLVATWGPLLLAVAAFGASGYSIVTGTPIERVIVRERVVEKPVIEERIVVQRETVTITVPVPGAVHDGGWVSPPATTTPTTLPPGTSPPTTGAAPTTTTTTSVPVTTTSTLPKAGSSTTQTTGSPPDTGSSS